MVARMNTSRHMAVGVDLPFVTVERLRRHFREKYLLKQPQVDLMLQSSAQSLEQGLERLAASAGCQELIGVYHGLKGLFLNMGEGAWADYVREIEGRLKNGEELDHLAIAEVLRQGVAEVLFLLEVK